MKMVALKEGLLVWLLLTLAFVVDVSAFTYQEKDNGFEFYSELACEKTSGVDLLFYGKQIVTSSYGCGKGTKEYTSISTSRPLDVNFHWANSVIFESFSEHSMSMYSPEELKVVEGSFDGKKSIIKTFITILGMKTFISQRYVLLPNKNSIMSIMAVSY